MKVTFGLIAILLLLTSCSKDECLYTGDLTVTSTRVTEVDGVPINQLTVGLFDINVLETNRYWETEAIALGTFDGGKLEFKQINIGNYVVAITQSDPFPYRKTVQIKGGKNITVDLFD